MEGQNKRKNKIAGREGTRVKEAKTKDFPFSGFRYGSHLSAGCVCIGLILVLACSALSHAEARTVGLTVREYLSLYVVC